ncbi:MAG: RNA-binding S4 domain-containing protein [bacterium]
MMTGKKREQDEPEEVRLDRWLHAARFYKTRSRAARAVDGGKVKYNGSRPKRAQPVSVGDRLRIRKGKYEFRIVVEGLSEKRGPASEAEKLYRETESSKRERAELKEQLKAMPTPRYEGKGRPTKKERRELEEFREKTGWGT